MNSTIHPSDTTKPGEPTSNSNEKGQYDEEADSFLPRKNIDLTTRKRPSFREPITHLKNKSFIEVIFGSCFGDFGTQLSVDELVPFYDLKHDANKYFDNKCKDYDDLLREMWTDLTGNTLEEIENEGWKNYGFQNSNPRSDFRGGALLSLKQLLYFVKTNKDKIETLSSDTSSFLFAVSSINVTYFLIKYYHLSNDLVYSKDKKIICSRVALKTFCSVLRVDKNILNKIHGLLLNDLHSVWQDLRKKIPGLTLMDFNMALNIVKEKMFRLTKSHIYDSYEGFREIYLRLETVLPDRKASYSR